MAPRKRKPASEEDVAEDPIGTEPRSGRRKSLVFISHDSRDADLAEAFANLLIDVSAGTLKSFRSSDKRGNSGIEFGAEWYKSIMSQLGDATDVVALLTPRSVDRPWILYEAGVARGKLDTTVLGVALGVPLERVSTGPFGQFQNCAGDEESLTKLMMQLLSRNPDASPRAEAVRLQVHIFGQRSAELLQGQAEKDGATSQETDEQSTAKLFEEVKAMVRELPGRIEDRSRSRRGLSRHGPRFHPALIEELLMHSRSMKWPGSHAAAWLFFISLFREEAPWLYEVGLDVYRALLSDNPTEIESAAFPRDRGIGVEKSATARNVR